jgi:serine protease Do
MVANTIPDKEVTINLIRDGKEKTVEVKITEMPPEVMKKIPGIYDNLLKGVQVQNITPNIRKSFGIPERIKGVLVVDVVDDGPADEVFRKNDVIMEINKKQIDNLKDYRSVVLNLKPDKDILLLIYRNNSAIYITLSAK